MDKYERIRIQLLSTRAELQQRVVSITDDVRHSREPLSQDFAEQAVERENEEVMDALGNAARLELNQIRKALERMDQGEYDLCEDCGNAIAQARLIALPYTNTCITCAQRAEQNH